MLLFIANHFTAPPKHVNHLELEPLENRLAPAAMAVGPVQNQAAPVLGPALAAGNNQAPNANSQANQGVTGIDQSNGSAPNQTNNQANSQPTSSQLANIGMPNTNTAINSNSGINPTTAQPAFPSATPTAAAFVANGAAAAFFANNVVPIATLPAGITGLFSDNNRTGLGFDLTAHIARQAAVGASVPALPRVATQTSFYPSDERLVDGQSVALDYAETMLDFDWISQALPIAGFARFTEERRDAASSTDGMNHAQPLAPLARGENEKSAFGELSNADIAELIAVSLATAVP